jgi:hypothetical protein
MYTDASGTGSIGGADRMSGWNLIIGSNFGVRTNIEGKSELWCNNANITGKITATQLVLDGAKLNYSDIEDPPTIPDVSIYIAKDGTIGSAPSDDSTGFKVSSAGLLEASNATIYGTIYASAGKIGGIEISPGNGLHYSGTDANDGFGLWRYGVHPNGATSNSIIFHAGGNDNNIGTAPFRVLADGTVYASKANISGTITATGGAIGGWTLASNTYGY